MSKVLVINGANFTENRLDVIGFADIPCTGISFDSNTLTIDGLKSATLTPVLTPQDTTDEVVWRSSVPDVISVSNGIVTAKKYGSAVITATCGNYSAAVTVTAEMALIMRKGVATTVSYKSSAEQLHDFVNLSTLTNGASIASDSNDYPCYFTDANVDYFYPINIPEGAKTITVNASGLGLIIVYYKHDAFSSEAKTAQEFERDCAKVLHGETLNANTPYSISAWTYDQRTFTIPEVDGIDSFTIGCKASSTSVLDGYTEQNPNVTITFGFE